MYYVLMPMPGHVDAIAHSMPMPHANANVISFQVNQLNQLINQSIINQAEPTQQPSIQTTQPSIHATQMITISNN
jgi:hypothetical protein